VSYSHNIQLKCDTPGCNVFSDFMGLDEEEADEAGTEAGWTCTAEGKHYCPGCSEKRRAEIQTRLRRLRKAKT
jgi:hypothetical protein